MYLYNTNTLKQKMLNMNKQSPVFKGISNFFSLKNMITVLGIKEVYMHNDFPTIFINSSDVNKICYLASSRFAGDFDYLHNETPPIMQSFELSGKYKKTVVSNLDDLSSMLKEHSINSNFGKFKRSQKEKDQIDKEVINKRLANLDNDFSGKIVAIDFEFRPFSSDKEMLNNIKEFGLAIRENNNLIYSNYIIEGEQTKKSFKFGASIIIPRNKVVEIINEHIKDAETLLFHAHSADYNILRRINVFIPNTASIIDTLIISKTHFKKDGEDSIGLSELLKKLNIKHIGLHNSGNDAAFTLKAFINLKGKYDLDKKNNTKTINKKRSHNGII